MSETILSVKDLTVEFDDNRILDDIAFEVNDGEVFVVLGPNGAGKTVLLRTILGLLAYKGSVEWKNGVKIGYVPQRLPFVKDFPLTVGEFFGLKDGHVDPKEALISVGIKDEGFYKKSMETLSSGQFQRVLVAWALLGDPDVLLFDEPTAGIDIGGEETIYTLLQKLKKEKGLTIVLVTHDMNVVYREADKVLCLNHKRMCFGLPKEVLDSQKMADLFGGDVRLYTHEHHEHHDG